MRMNEMAPATSSKTKRNAVKPPWLVAHLERLKPFHEPGRISGDTEDTSLCMVASIGINPGPGDARPGAARACRRGEIALRRPPPRRQDVAPLRFSRRRQP